MMHATDAPKTLILRTAGTNCDVELAHAFRLAGSEPTTLHLNRLIDAPERLDGYDLLGLPGGFSYGDDIAAGRILANRLRHRLYPALRQFVADGKPVIGICNGFQVLVKTGLLGDFDPQRDAEPPRQVCTLADNAFPRFLDKWIDLRVEPETRCIWTRGLDELPLPIAHGEGRFVADEAVLDRLEENGQIALRYADNPNGSMRDIAGICDASGLVFGLMPHPERYVDPTHHPAWTAGQVDGAMGLKMFENAVEHARQRTASAVG